MDDGIREGFLCPICLKDLKSPTHLSAHFEEFHADDKDVLQQLRSVFGKAKRKLLKKEDAEASQEDTDQPGAVVSHGTPGSGGMDLALWETQKFGHNYSHMKTFRQQRKVTIERCVVETNKLLIRLDKLIKSGIYASDSSLPNAVKTRRNVEKAVVPWENDNSVKFCPNCSKKFSLTYRRHHCRLCGKVTCERCLDNINMNLTCKSAPTTNSQKPVQSQQNNIRTTFCEGDVLKLDQSTSAMYVKLNRDPDDDNGLRACDPCHELLLRQNKLFKDKSANSVLLQLYERVQISMREADAIQPKFMKMADSVNAGETEYGIEAAMETRVKLLKAYESVESISKRIQLLGLDKEKQPHPQVLKLQRSIRSYCSNYLANNMFTLPSLPTKEKYAEMLQQKIKERERMKAIKSQTSQKSTVRNNNSPIPSYTQEFIDKTDGYSNDVQDTRSASNASNFFGASASKFKAWTKEPRPVFQAVSISKKKDTSWGPVQVSTDHSSDPLVQQIENIKGYIRQAIKDKKFDEVKMFEQNLKELELIYLENSRT